MNSFTFIVPKFVGANLTQAQSLIKRSDRSLSPREYGIIAKVLSPCCLNGCAGFKVNEVPDAMRGVV